MFSQLIRPILISLIALFTADVIRSQTPRLGSIAGTVTDVQGGLIVGAEVVLTLPDGRKVTARTDRTGGFTFPGLEAAKYQLTITHTGFAPYSNPEVTASAGRSSTLDIKLGVTIEETQVTVTDAAAVSTDPESTAGAIVLKQSEIEALPDDPAELEEALRALAGPSAGPSGGGIYIDGFSGGRLPSRDSIREIRINQNPFSSEFDRMGLGRIEIFTKPGTDEFNGEVEFEFEDESLNSRNPFSPNRAPFQVLNLEGNFSGPIIEDRVSFFVDGGREHTENNALINAVVLGPGLVPTPFAISLVRPDNEFEFSPRFDIQFGEKYTLSTRYFFETERTENAGVGGFNLPSRAFDSRQSEHTFRNTFTAVLSASTINETRFQFRASRASEEQLDDSPTIQVLDSFTGGGANTGNAFSRDHSFELHNHTSLVKGEHLLKFGGRLRNTQLSDSSPNNFAGTFTFTSIDQYRDTILNLPDAFPTQFTIAGGEPEVTVKQTDVGIFVQDDWKIDPSLTISFGLRYENQTNISSNFDVSPRFAIAWAPGNASQSGPATVIRGGFGVFYERVSESLTMQAERFNGVNQLRYIVTDPAILDPIVFTEDGVSDIPDITALVSLPQTTRIVSPELRTPYTMQAAVSIERQLPWNTTASASYVHARTRRMLRSRNVNAPLNGVQPIPNAGNIYQYESTGRFDQNQLIFNFRTNPTDSISIFANYALGKARGDTDGAGTFPANSYDLSGEYGDAAIDVRHRFVVGGNFEAPFGIAIRPFVTYRSAPPFNIITGIDSNGDSVFTERPAFATELGRQCDFGSPGNPDIRDCVVQTAFGNFDLLPIAGQTIIPRNYGRGEPFFNVNLRVSKEFEFGGKEGGGRSGNSGGGDRGRGGINNPFGGGRGGGQGGSDSESRFSIDLSLAIRNLFNHTNPGLPVGNLRSSLFGVSTSSAGGFGFGSGGNSSAGNRRIEIEIQFRF